MDRSEILLDENIINLNCGACGSISKKLFQLHVEAQKRFEEKGILYADNDYGEAYHKARAELAGYVNANVENLVILPNVTFAISYVINSLELSEIVISNQRYHGYERLWKALEGQGIKVKCANIPTPVSGDEEIIESIFAEVCNETSLLYLDHISSATSLILPIKEICARAKALGVPTLVDGAHSVGQINVNLTEIGADFYMGNCHKWMCGPKGVGFMVVSEPFQEKLKPLVYSWGAKFPNSSGKDFIDNCLWMGTANLAAVSVIPELIKDLTSESWKDKQANARELANEALKELTDTFSPDISPYYSPGSRQFAQMITHPLPRCNFLDMKNAMLENHGVHIKGLKFDGRHAVRCSFHVYNDRSDIENLLTGLKDYFSL